MNYYSNRSGVNTILIVGADDELFVGSIALAPGSVANIGSVDVWKASSSIYDIAERRNASQGRYYVLVTVSFDKAA